MVCVSKSLQGFGNEEIIAMLCVQSPQCSYRSIGLYPYAQKWPNLTLPCRACGPVYAPRLYAEVDSSNLAENDGITKLVDTPCHDFYESVCVNSHQLVLYSILTAASTLAMVMGVPVFIGT